MNAINRYFGIEESGSTVRREVVGGLTTFATMSYIVFVQPTVLAFAGMDFGAVLLATCLSAAFASILMGVVAKYPFALAPGMGENFLFAFTVCGPVAMRGMGFSWQAGLTIVFIAGLLFVVLSIFRTREKVLEVLPPCLTNSIGPAIGLFIGFIGLQWGGIITSSPTTMVHLGSFHTGPALMTVFGVFLIAVLHARGIKGSILIGILATCAIGLATGVIPWNVEPVNLNFSTFFQLNASELLEHWDKALLAIALFFFLDLFDTVGTLVGVSSQAGFLREDGTLPRAGRAFLSDALGSCAGALFGTSTVTSYIESASGVAAGARTGLAAVVTGLCFIVAIALAPIIRLAGQDVGAAFAGAEQGALYVSMYPGVAAALIFVGFLMMTPLRKIKWDDITESLPAFLTIAIMVFGYGITEGIAAGCVSFAVIKLLAGRGREAHPIMYAIALAFIVRYAFLV